MKSLFTTLALTAMVVVTATAGTQAPFETVSSVTTVNTVTVSGSAGVNL